VSTTAPLRRNLVTPTTLVLAALAAIGLYFVAQRFVLGLGAVTHLNSGYPWGMWVVVDVVIGTAFGCGGFAMALLVYIFNRGEYHPLIRPALLGGLFGYTLAGFAVVIDLGRYWQAYNLLLPWYAQPNSVMYEVALCVMAYVTVLWIEFSPAFLERWGIVGVKRVLERWMFVIIALGVLLPAMHQSSLGSVLLVMGSKLSPLWFTLWLPVLFVVSALAMGHGVVMLEATVVSNSFALPSEHAARLALRTQQILAAEAGGTDTADPLGGSYYIEALTDELASRAWELIERVDYLGGAVAAIEEGFVQDEIEQAAFRYQQQVESGERVIVGVNRFHEDEEEPIELHRLDPAAEQRQLARTTKLRAERDAADAQAALARVRETARGTENMLPQLREALRARCTIGEICDELRDEWGMYDRQRAPV